MFVNYLYVFFGEMSVYFFGPFFDWVIYFSGIELQELLIVPIYRVQQMSSEYFLILGLQDINKRHKSGSPFHRKLSLIELLCLRSQSC